MTKTDLRVKVEDDKNSDEIVEIAKVKPFRKTLESNRRALGRPDDKLCQPWCQFNTLTPGRCIRKKPKDRECRVLDRDSARRLPSPTAFFS